MMRAPSESEKAEHGDDTIALDDFLAMTQTAPETPEISAENATRDSQASGASDSFDLHHVDSFILSPAPVPMDDLDAAAPTEAL